MANDARVGFDTIGPRSDADSLTRTPASEQPHQRQREHDMPGARKDDQRARGLRQRFEDGFRILKCRVWRSSCNQNRSCEEPLSPRDARQF